MSKLNNLKAAVILKCFTDEMGNHFSKVCADVDSNLGRLEKDILTTSGDWKCGAKGMLVSKDGNKLQLPLNAGWATLVRFGLRLNEVCTAGSSLEPRHEMTLQANIPAEAEAWFKTNYRDKQVTPKVTA
jgi:hypothetical protein